MALVLGWGRVENKKTREERLCGQAPGVRTMADSVVARCLLMSENT